MRREFTLTLVALALLALTACSVETEVTPPNPSQGDEISFGSVSTRVDSASEIEEFSVWATVSSIGSNAVSYQPLLTNERVYRNPAGSNTWAYENVQRWLPNSIFHFFAAYPYNIGFQQVRGESENGNLLTVYTLNVTADGSADTEDILVATNATDTTVEGYNETVDLKFTHLLTKVNLKIRQDFNKDPDFDYFITKVTITGLKSSGTFGIMPYSSNEPYYFSGWNIDNTTTFTIEKTFDTPQILRAYGEPDPKNKIINTWEDGILLIPQEIAAKSVKVRIDYLYDMTPGDGDPGTTNHYVEGYLPTNIINQETRENLWQSGRSINYTLKVAEQNDITFAQPTINPWGAPQTGGTIIIK